VISKPTILAMHSPFLRLALLATLALAPCAATADTVRVRILAINDFHGHVEPPEGVSGSIASQPAGGAAYLAAHLRRLRGEAAHHVFVSAGDLVNASPFVSALFDDEPTIAAMNRMGLVLNAVGNHEFDDGVDELLRLQRGGCHPQRGCRFGERFDGARFRFLAANVTRVSDGETLFPAYEVLEFDGVRIAFIGLTLEGTRFIVNARGIQGWTFRDEADTVNALVPQLQARGVEAIVVLIHEGGYAGGGVDECPQLSGALTGILERLHPAVDVVVSGHTHQAYNCSIEGRVVTSAGSFGRLVTRIDVEVDRASRDIVRAQARNEIVTRDLPKDEAVEAIVREAVAAAALHDRPAGTVRSDLLRAGIFPPDIAAGGTGESVLGNLVADAQLWATRAAPHGAAQIAFMNPGGLRSDILRGRDGQVRFSQLFGAQPFSNALATLTLSGAQIVELLEQQFPGHRNSQSLPRILQVSDGFSYAWSASAPAGQRIRDVRLHGKPLTAGQRYRVTVNDFLLNGGDRFAVLKEGTDVDVGPVDVEALEAYFQAFSPVEPPRLGRVRRVP
jgi:5'-nucleotidase